MIFFLEKVIIFGLTFFSGFQIYRAVKYGKCAFKFTDSDQQSEPIRFWVSVVCSMSVFVVGVWLLFLPEGLGS